MGASSVVTGIARGLKVDGEERTLAQIEADVFRDLLIDAVGQVPSDAEGNAPVDSPAARRGVRALRECEDGIGTRVASSAQRAVTKLLLIIGNCRISAIASLHKRHTLGDNA